MGRNLDRGLEDRNEKDRYNNFKRDSSADKVREETKKKLYDNLR